MYKLTTGTTGLGITGIGITGIGIIGIGIIGIFTDIEITGDTDGAFVMDFMETTYTSPFIMDSIETIFTTVSITIQIITCQTIETEDTIDTLTIEMLEIIRTTKEATRTEEIAFTAAVGDRTAMLDEMQLP